MKTQLDSIQIWAGATAPECYRKFIPTPGEFDWIAVVQPNAITDFKHHLRETGYRLDINIVRHVLSDGTWMFCGLTKECAKSEQNG